MKPVKRKTRQSKVPVILLGVSVAVLAVGLVFAVRTLVKTSRPAAAPGVGATESRAEEQSPGTGGAAAETPSDTETPAPSATDNTSGKAGNKVTATPAPDKPYLLRVNLTQNIVTIYALKDGEYTLPVRAMVCSVGLDGGTPEGTFSTSNKYVWRPLEGGVYGQYATRITGSILFHSVPYFTQSKDNLEYEEYNKLGQPASLGCVRLSVVDAKWIYDNCPLGTTVEMYSSGDAEPLPRPAPARIDTSDPRRGWDPTDPDPDNPWRD